MTANPAAALTDPTAERMVIGWMQLAPRDAGELSSVVAAEDFADPRNAAAFAAVLAVIERTGDVDFASVSRELHSRGSYNAVGGPQYIAECAEVEREGTLALTAAAAFGAAQIVADLAVRRAVIDAALNATIAARDLTRDVSEVTEVATRAIGSATSRSVGWTGRPFAEALAAVMERAANPGAADGVSFRLPWPVIDRRIGGLRRKRLHIIAGRPAMGKSAFIQNAALALSMPSAWWPEADAALLPAPTPVLFFSLEMPDEENALRGLGSLVRVDTSAFEQTGIPEHAVGSALAVCQKAARAKFNLDERTTAVTRMRAVATQFFRRHGKGVMIVDYLQLANARGLDDLDRSSNREQKVAAMTKEFKRLAMDLDIAVVVLAQLNRAAASKPEDDAKRPSMENLRESGAIEQDADVILLLWGKRPTPHDKTQEINVAVEKVRGRAAGGDVPMIFARSVTRFEEAPDAALSEPHDLAATDADEPADGSGDEGYSVGGYRRPVSVAPAANDEPWDDFGPTRGIA